MPSDPTLYLYTSLTAGSSHIITATSRIETILKANKIPFQALDCATNERARLLWTRRSKGRKIPGLVKFNDVIADLEQVEEWNEHGELEDQIEEQIDIFGDVPISSTSDQAHAAAAAREEAQRAAAQGSGEKRTASETRHISISEPESRKKSEASGEHNMSDKKDTPLSIAMKQAGEEAAKKAGKDTRRSESGLSTTVESMPPPSIATAAKTLDPDVEEPETLNTQAKTPEQLSKEGMPRSNIDKSAEEDVEASTGKSTIAQVLEKRRQSSQANAPSSLAKTTSIDESHTVTAPEDSTTEKSEEPSKMKTTEEELDEDEETSEPVQKAAKVSATGTEEAKVLKEPPQDTAAADPSKAGDSVAD